LIRILDHHGRKFYREGKGDHRLYIRYLDEKKRIVPIDMGAKEFSPVYGLRIFRQFGFTDDEMADFLKKIMKLPPPFPDPPRRNLQSR